MTFGAANLQKKDSWRPDAAISVLECGSGPGLLLRLIEKWFPKVSTYGLDLDSSLIRVADREATRSRFTEASAEEIPFRNQSFDIVFALHIIEHLPHPDRFVNEAHRVLKPGKRGRLIIATPNPGGICARIMGQRWNGWSDETHINLHPPTYWQVSPPLQRFHNRFGWNHGTLRHPDSTDNAVRISQLGTAVHMGKVSLDTGRELSLRRDSDHSNTVTLQKAMMARYEDLGRPTQH